MHDFLIHVEAYGTVAGILIVLAILFLFVLARRYAATKYTIRNPGK